MSIHYFPQSIAANKAFLGRQQEFHALMHNIELGHHTLLIAPNGFGKTSLARYTSDSMKLSFIKLNFLLAKTTKSVEKKIVEGISHFLNNLPDNAPVLTAFNLLENFLSESDKKVVFIMDEIQTLHELEEKETLQKVIHEFARQSKQVVFIFSGSNNRLLHAMFDDKAMPLHQLSCERIYLEKINESDYKNYINQAAISSFGKKISEETFQQIINLTESHPKRVYNLCYQIWKEIAEDKKVNPAAPNFIETCWLNYIATQVSDVRYRLSQLNTGQLKALTLVAKNIPCPTGREAQNRADLSGASITKALSYLEEVYYILRSPQNTFTIIDPVVKEVILRYDSFNVD